MRKTIFFGPHVIWLAPAADALPFLLFGLVLALLARRWPQRITWPRATGCLAFFSLLSWLLIFPKLQAHAAALLAAGAAVQVARLLRAREAFLYSFVKRASVRLSIGVGLLMIGTFAWLKWAEQNALAQLPQAPPHAPNVLLIVLDTVRAQNLSLYGYVRSTAPNLTQLAQQGVRFEWAISTAPWTLPAHASMFTGRWPHELSADWEQPLDQQYPTLAEVLRARGYLTAGFVANQYYCNVEHGLARGFLHYEDYQVSWAELLLSSSLLRRVAHNAWLRRVTGFQQVLTHKTAAQINRDFLAWLAQQPPRPFFAFLNYFDAHEPYLPPAPYNRRFGARQPSPHWPHQYKLRSAQRVQLEKLPAAENQAALDAYDGAIAYLDQQLGWLFAELEQRGFWQDTLVIITSDHGEAFGEHGFYAHGDNLHLQALRVPLVLSFPARMPVGQSIAAPVSPRDLPATVMDVLGLPATFPGASLARYWNGATPPTAPLFSAVNVAPIQPRRYPAGSRAVLHSLVFDRYHYLKHPAGQESVYDFLDDPEEQHDLAGSDAGRHVLLDCRERLRQLSEMVN